jgi:short-subunit dehydrogenase
MRKLALVTGATSGIGKSLVLTLLKANIDVIGLGRSDEKIEQLKKEVHHLDNKSELMIVKGDLSDHEGIMNISNQVIHLLKEKNIRLDYMCHVAGRVTSGYHISKDNHELTFQVNHLAVVDLTYQLLDYMNQNTKSRILVVSSQSHYRANINFNNLETKTFYSILRSYKRSKLYNVLFVKGFAGKYKDIPIYAIDPGLVKTDIGTKNTSKLASFIWTWRAKKGIDPEVAARHMLNVITEPNFDNQSGSYVRHGVIVTSNPITYKEEVIERLWNETLHMLEINDFFAKKN